MEKNSYANRGAKRKSSYKTGLAFPKIRPKKPRKRHAKSILQPKEDRHCFLCLQEGNDQLYEVLHEHHVFYGTANRQKSEEYGLKVNLCLSHHETGEHAVHKDRKTDLRLKKLAQYAFEQTYTREEFRNNFGRSYL